MPTVNLVPQGANLIGATVSFSSPNAPAVAAGDPFVIAVTAPPASQAPNGLHGVGYSVPQPQSANDWPKYVGDLAPGATAQIWGTASVALNLSEGIGLAIGVMPPGGITPVAPAGAYQYEALIPAGPPPAPPVLGLDYLVSIVMASQFTGVPLADWRTQGVQGITFVAAPPYAPPSTVTLYPGTALNLIGSQAIANALGGSVVQVSPDPQYVMFATQEPLVNGVEAMINGKPMQAVAADIAHAFDYILSGAATVRAQILGCFAAVAS